MDVPLTITEASALIAKKRLSPVELTKNCLARIERLNPTLNAFLLVTSERALADARASEARIMKGGAKGPLDGIPIAYKDIFSTAGTVTTGQSALLRDCVPSEDATTVRLLREAGAVLLGKTATWEFAMGGSSFDLPWPPARNPWNTALDPAGSSSGSAAAVAAGLCPGAMGSDTGGSIRGPAAWSGIAGHKPTYGLLSRYGILPLSSSLDHAGPMCWTARDCAHMIGPLAAHDPLDPASADPGPLDFTGGLGGSVQGLRVGVVRHFFERDVETEPEVVAALESAISVLMAGGATIANVTLAPFAEYGAVLSLISRAEAFAFHEHWLRTQPGKYGAYSRRRLMCGAFVEGSDYVNAMRHRARLIAEMADVMRGVDVLVFPTARGTASPLGEDLFVVPPKRQPFFNRVFNVTGGPALSICNGFSREGLPLSLQVAGRPFEDGLVLAVGDLLERELGTRSRRPDLEAAGASAPVAAQQPGGGTEPTMTFEERFKMRGLPTLPAAEMAELEALVEQLDEAAEVLRGPRPLAEESLSVLRLQPTQRTEQKPGQKKGQTLRVPAAQ